MGIFLSHRWQQKKHLYFIKSEIKSRGGKTSQQQFYSPNKTLHQDDVRMAAVWIFPTSEGWETSHENLEPINQFKDNLCFNSVLELRSSQSDFSYVDLRRWSLLSSLLGFFFFFLSAQEEKSISGACVAAQGQMVAHVMITESPR